MPLKLLVTADLHLGRLPGRLPEALTDQVPVRELGPAAAWRRLVELALTEKVNALLIAGDVVEGEFDFFEAYRELKQGVERLVEAGVRVVAVAGNHDTQILPRFADELDGFELLGRGGELESTTISESGEELTLWGWSFPRKVITGSPLAGHPFERGPGPNLGLLHCDLDQTASRYAPVRSQTLEDTGLDGWLLGHVHKPHPLTAPRPFGYLGSLAGLDPGEPGPHGPWLLTVKGGQIREVRQHPLSPLRWLDLDVDLEGIADPESARSRLLERFGEVHEQVRVERDPPRALGARLTFTGRTGFRQEIADLFEQEDLDGIRVGDGSIHFFVTGHRMETLPEVDLEELAAQPDPAGLLAQRLLLLEQPAEDPERARFIAGAREALERVSREAVWNGLERDAPGLEETEAWLRRAGRQALDLLLSKKEGA